MTWSVRPCLTANVGRSEKAHEHSVGQDDIDLIGPAERRPLGFDFLEHGLDIVVEPDFSSWRWKDRDELEWNVDAGRYTRAEADALYVEGKRAVDRLLREHARFKGWSSWRPDPTWAMAVLPVGWDVV